MDSVRNPGGGGGNVRDVIVVGDGPAGLSAALFLAKRGMSVTVLGKDTSGTHKAYLLNYLGIPEMDGDRFLQLARQQVSRFGAELRAAEAVAVERDGEGFAVVDAAGERHRGRYLILATGRARALAEQLGLEFDGPAVRADRDCRTSLDRVYAVGRIARDEKSQVAISAGDGAAAALDILSREAGRPVRDWDTPPPA